MNIFLVPESPTRQSDQITATMELDSTVRPSRGFRPMGSSRLPSADATDDADWLRATWQSLAKQCTEP